MYTTAMTLTEIYTKYQIPPNLIRHQLEVTAVGDYVCSHWNGPKIDKKLVTETLLLHDMGNIIKFKRPFLEELEKDAKYWEAVQDEYFQKYGNDVSRATSMIVSELGFDEVSTILDEMISVWKEPERTVSWEARICELSDCCVTPRGVEGFEIRLQDLKDRYHQTESDPSVRYMRENLEVIRPHLTINPAKIAEVDFSEDILNLEKYQFPL